jgi:hypothetical protein
MRLYLLAIRKLILRNHALNIFGLAFDTISDSPIGLDGHKFDNRINCPFFGSHTALRTLNSMVNVIV